MGENKNKKPGRKVKIPDDVKTKWVTLVDAKREKQNLGIRAACAEVSKELKQDVNPSIYNWWKAKLEGKDPRVNRKGAFGRKLAKEAEALVTPAMERHAHEVGSLIPSPKGVKVTVREYSFEGSPQEVLDAVNSLKK
jgi:hypothetical protein